MVSQTKKNTVSKKSPPNKKRKKAGADTKRKTTFRDVSQFAGLNKRLFSRVKQEYHDCDYADQLDDKTKTWLNSFMEETLGARFNHAGKKLIKSVAKKKEIYTENNARQRDIYGQSKASGRNVDIDPDFIIETMQSSIYTDDHEEQLLQRRDDENEILTVSEYLALKRNGAIIPADIKNFYDELFKNDPKFLKLKNHTKKITKK